MPVTHEIDARNRIVRLALSGTLSTAEMIETLDRAARGVEGRPGFRVLSDHRAIETPATREQVEKVVAHLEREGSVFRGTRWGIVTIEPASYGMMRMLGVLAEKIPIEVRIFETTQDAEAWLLSRE
jgi:hypothetical protein